MFALATCPDRTTNEYTALVSFSTGAVGVLNCSYVTGAGVFRAEFHGRNISPCVDAASESFIRRSKDDRESYQSRAFATKDGLPGDESPNWMGFWHENRHFIDCVRQNRQPLTHFADAVKSMELVERIRQEGTDPT